MGYVEGRNVAIEYRWAEGKNDRLPAHEFRVCEFWYKAPRPPTGDAWLNEIKHDGFRVIARKGGARVRLYSRPGNDLTIGSR